jgi:hypothetical protein
MIYEVLIIDLPGLVAPLSKHFRVRGFAGVKEAPALLLKDSSGVVVAAARNSNIPALLQLAAGSPPVCFFWLADDPAVAEAASADSLDNVVVLPAGIGAPWLQSLIAKALRDQEQKRESRELLDSSVSGTVSTLFEVLSIADPYSASIGQRLRYAIDLFCKSAQLEVSWELETAALLAEIGVLTIPVRVVTRSQSGQELSGFEKDLIAHIPERGADLLQHVHALHEVSTILRYQNKNYDGSGLPSDTLAGEKIPVGARILKVLNDLFKLKDNGKTQEEAIREMKAAAGRYDPALLGVAADCFKVNVPTNTYGNTQPSTVRELRPGQLLVSDIVTDDGVLVIRDGQVISARLLHKLRNFAFTSGIKEPIYVIDLLESRKMTSMFQDLAQCETTFLAKK